MLGRARWFLDRRPLLGRCGRWFSRHTPAEATAEVGEATEDDR